MCEKTLSPIGYDQKLFLTIDLRFEPVKLDLEKLQHYNNLWDENLS